MKTGLIIVIASVSALLAVSIGAFGAHGASGEQAKAWIVNGAQQHMTHSLAMFVAAFLGTHGAKRAALSIPLFGFGMVLFSGSLYALALGAPKAVAMLAPLGGLSFMIGWAVLAYAGWQLWRGEEL